MEINNFFSLFAFSLPLEKIFEILILSICIITIFILKKILNNNSNIKFNNFISSGSMELNNLINAILIETRLYFNCDRCYILEFHNGNYFTTSNPIWKVSTTYENCVSGITYITKIIQDILVTNVIDFISPIMTGKISQENTNSIKIFECERSKRIGLIDVNEMQHSYIKQLYINNGTKKILYSNILIDNGNVGVLVIEFCRNLEEEELIKILNIKHKICDMTDRISFLLKQKKYR